MKYVIFPRYLYRIEVAHMGDQNKRLLDQTMRFARAVQHLNFEISHYPYDFGWNVKQHFFDAGIIAPEKTKNDGKSNEKR